MLEKGMTYYYPRTQRLYNYRGNGVWSHPTRYYEDTKTMTLTFKEVCPRECELIAIPDPACSPHLEAWGEYSPPMWRTKPEDGWEWFKDVFSVYKEKHPGNSKREKIMHPLVKLALGDAFEEDKISIVPNNEIVRNELDWNIRDEKTKEAEAAASALRELAASISSYEKKCEDSILYHERTIEELKKRNAARKRALAYGNATDNYLPLAFLLNYLYASTHEVPEKLRKVPEDWVETDEQQEM